MTTRKRYSHTGDCTTQLICIFAGAEETDEEEEEEDTSETGEEEEDDEDEEEADLNQFCVLNV